ncbi:NfeD family protein [Phycisphaera mikurensis]|uniref:Uncharacterized protein n=1 Tax=Phycisphaera mikurensis (strain NBRC 102666 / KCTC 22515 / FYK2301M01) TaxID=1142394 RepID=I0ICH4_PHYMF|nr:NfeD family protein [Phycisphaera mikurensis]MBB6442162.1 membrane-bound serine protease (ClpP class) [Phycisphaera mikurensis]BAM02962.1 hypothetical protein PSMK_08030 [Phycisphaera mikurensis NBRC 102666]
MARRALLLLICLLLLAPLAGVGAAAPGAPGAVPAPRVAEPEPEVTPAPAGPTGPAETAPPATEAAAATPPPAVGSPPAATPIPRRPPLLVLPSGAEVAVIPIEGMIYDFTTDSLRRRMERARAGGATVFVLSLDTPGGVVTSAIDIAKLLKSTPEPTIAWINDQAYSAGSLIATSCDYLVVAPSSSFGDSAPVSMVGELAPTERAKALSPLLNEYRDNARANGHDYAALQAMCVLGVELYYVEDPATGRRHVVNQADHAVLVGGLSPAEADEKIAAMADLAGTGSAVGRPARELADAASAGAWRAVEQLPSGRKLPGGRLHDGSTLYTLSQTEAIDTGIAEAEARTEADLQALLNAASVSTVGQTWSEALAMFLTNPFVRMGLIAIFGIGLFVEMLAPGFGLAGGVALLALAALIGAPLLVGLSEIWHIGLMVIGVVMIVIELLATPTFGLMGIVGVGAVLAGLVLSTVPSSGGGPVPLPAPGTGGRLASATIATLLAFVVTGFASLGLMKVYGRVPGLSRLVLGDAPAIDARSAPPGPDADGAADRGPAVGETGTVRGGGLRPSGSIAIGDRWIDAVSAGGFIEEGTAVTVVEVAGNRVVVEAAA